MFATHSAKKKKTCLQPSIKITNKKITIILVSAFLFNPTKSCATHVIFLLVVGAQGSKYI